MRGITLLTLACILLIHSLPAQAKEPVTPADDSTIHLSSETASGFARLALNCIHREYPNKLSHVMNDSSEVLGPHNLHPAFYGCFDWHSSVHGHWMLVRLLKLYPHLPEAAEIRAALDDNLSAENIGTEIAYLHQKSRKSFERTYGWAWLLKLAEELELWNDPDGNRWADNLKPLAEEIVGRYLAFFPKQTYPIRTGVHPNTAFGIAFALDYSNSTENTALKDLLIERSLTYYGSDMDYPAAWEPGGEDFFSPALMEADLVRRVLQPQEFASWFHRFLPGIETGEARTLLEPAIVADRSDPKIVHLDGLNLSRAWCMMGIAHALPNGDPARTILLDSAAAHANSTLKHITSGNYEGEHWLASFAVYLLSSMNRTGEQQGK